MKRIRIIRRMVWLELLRRKDAYVLLILLGALLAWLFTVDGFGLEATTRYLLDAGLLLAWVGSLILCITLAARQLPAEEARGTIFTLLSKPLTRGELIVGKWLGAWHAAAAASLAFYAVVLLAAGVRGHLPDPASVAQAWVLHAASLAVVAAGAVALSARLTHGGATTLAFVLTAADYLLVPRIPAQIVYAEGVRATLLSVLYYALPHLEVFDMRRRVVHDWGLASWAAVAAALAYAAALTAVLLLLAWFGYRNRRFHRPGGA